MSIDSPKIDQLPQLRSLWKEAFGDTDAYLDSFFTLGFSPERCRCMTEDGQVSAALYWFDCSCQGARLAYLYAVATAENRRGEGLCRLLMDNTHAHLKKAGYAGAILVPASASLRQMYEKMGYLPATRIRELRCAAGEKAVTLTLLDRDEYEHRRPELLPPDGVVQTGPITALLADQCSLWGGQDFLLAAWIEEGVLHAEELLGNTAAAPEILKALGAKTGVFQTPGNGEDFAMYLPFCLCCPKPGYFGISLG